MLRDMMRSLRMLRRDPGFSLLTVVVLALGIGATTTLFSVLDSVLWRPLPFAESERLVSVLEGAPGDDEPTFAAAYLALRETETLTHVTATYHWAPVLRGTGRPGEVQGLATSAGLFGLLRSRAQIGTVYGPEPEAATDDVVVLAHSLWQRVFGGDPEILGRRVSLDGEQHVVVGVMPPDFAFPTFWAEGAELWAPFRLTPEQVESPGRFLRVFARLADDATLEDARSEADLVASRLEDADPENRAGLRFRVAPLLEPTVGDSRTALWVLFGMVGLVLLVACANVASLFFARSLSRRRDLAVRRALGAGRLRSAVQIAAESLWLAFLGGVLGVALSAWALEALVAFGPADLPRLAEIGMEPRAVVFALVLSVAAGLVFGLVPVLAQRRWDLRRALHGGRRSVGGGTGVGLRRALVVVEVALTLVLLAGAGLMVRTFLHLDSLDPGFERHRVLTLQLSLRGTEHEEPERQHAFYRSLVEAVETTPGVEAVGLINHLPVGDDVWRFGLRLSGRPAPSPGEEPRAVVRVASPGLFQALGIDLVAGRSVSASDRPQSARVALVNRAFAERHLGLPPDEVAAAIGQRFRIGGDEDEPEWSVVGVVGDLRQDRLTDAPRPEVIFPLAQNPVAFWPKASLVVRTQTEPAAVAQAVQDRLWRLEPDLSISKVRAMDEVLAATVGETRFQTFALGLFALLSLLLSAVGIYGLMTYLVAWRRSEIGLRMAVGADRRDILGWILAAGLRLVGAGVGVGLVLAWAGGRTMQGLVHGVEPGDGATLVGAALVLIAVAASAIAVPAVRAAALDPVKSLREE